MGVLKKTVVAIALAFPTLLFAQSTQDLQRQLEELKAKVKELEQAVDKKNTPSEDDIEMRSDVNRIKVKVEGMEDQQETNGFRNLKISGYADPSYIYNRNTHRSSFVFMN